ncbi:amylo-alpha-1,6-glucosidase [Nanoarchaeota archaeon]
MVVAIHKTGKDSKKKDLSNPSFLIANKLGGYCSLSSPVKSRYQGVYFMKDLDMYKVIEDIIALDALEVTKIVNNFHSVERYRGFLREKFFMPMHHKGLIYSLNMEKDVKLILECRKSYDLAEFGRHYKIHELPEGLVIEYEKKNDQTDSTEYSVFIAIKGFDSYKEIKQWTKTDYEEDKSRGSHPDSRHVYEALVMNGSKFFFGFGLSKEDALEEARLIKELEYENISNYGEHYKKLFRERSLFKNTDLSYKAALSGLDKLVIENNNSKAILAGHPWFFQIWSRDELISLGALIKDHKFKTVKKILIRHLTSIRLDGRLDNRQPAAGLDSADAIGWLMKRIKDYVLALEKERVFNYYISYDELEYIKNKVEESILGLLKNHSDDDFAVCNPKETWMDTLESNNGRSGIRIELQALRLCTYSTYKLLCKITNDNTGYKIAKKLEETLRKKTVENFWNGKYLKDGIEDDSIRPNVFIAHYVYPHLLSNKQWLVCFREVLDRLWNDWGGISTIDKKSELYQPTHTGENDISYHNGDSWFWLNNLAGLCMTKVSKERFKRKIKKIIEASSGDILWNSNLGTHSEISSSSKLEGKGCFNQAWSNAMFIELCDEFY